MGMAPTDILDVSGATYTYLMNGVPPDTNWTGLFRPGERVRLRFVNGSSMSIFDVRIPGLPLAVVQADGNEVEPVLVDEFRFGPAETYDVIVQPKDDHVYTIFAQVADRSGFACGSLATRPGLRGAVPALDPPPLRGMDDMGMGGMDGMKMDHGAMAHGSALKPGVSVDNVAMMPRDRLGEAGTGLDGNGRRVLRYADLRARRPAVDQRGPSREITLHLTGNMRRYIWGFDGRTVDEAEPILLARNERVRFVLINDTMMEHPVHLHGLWSELENGQGDFRPLKHTILVKPGERLGYLVTADVPGRWAFHCHLLYHMELGMFREVHVS
jgi:FtsP/CotA-like multicopper oxidase with cupredoxin domain